MGMAKGGGRRFHTIFGDAVRQWEYTVPFSAGASGFSGSPGRPWGGEEEGAPSGGLICGDKVGKRLDSLSTFCYTFPIPKPDPAVYGPDGLFLKEQRNGQCQ
jgi:hypothetical protein